MAYILFRGGHYYDIAYKCGELGIPLYTKIPIHIIAQGICRGLEGSGCSRAYLIYHPARRYRRLQARDLENLTRLTREICGVVLEPVTSYGELRAPGCVVSATLLPGRSVAFMFEPRLPVIIPFLIYLISDYMIEHIRDVLQVRRGPGGCCPRA
ncbi:MAG: hypothetical protein F7B95_03360 [Desulfurococcales archaeon]|nr:hypothetical protein [Desulfurococcales archaeon]